MQVPAGDPEHAAQLEGTPIGKRVGLTNRDTRRYTLSLAGMGSDLIANQIKLLSTVRITLTETPRGEFYTPMLSEKFFLRRSREASRATKHVFFMAIFLI